MGADDVRVLDPSRYWCVRNRAQPGLAHFRIFDLFDCKINFKYDMFEEICFIQNIKIVIDMYLRKVSAYGVIQSEIFEWRNLKIKGFISGAFCFTSLPGGNQVDGLPPVVNINFFSL